MIARMWCWSAGGGDHWKVISNEREDLFWVQIVPGTQHLGTAGKMIARMRDARDDKTRRSPSVANTGKGVVVLDRKNFSQKLEINSKGSGNTQLWVLYIVNVEQKKRLVHSTMRERVTCHVAQERDMTPLCLERPPHKLVAAIAAVILVTSRGIITLSLFAVLDYEGTVILDFVSVCTFGVQILGKA